MTTTAQLRDLSVAALQGATDAGGNIYSARTWPTISKGIPVLYVKAPMEDRASLGPNGAPEFTTTATIRFIGRHELPALPNDEAAYAMEQALERLKQQVEVQIINNPSIMSLLQQFPSTHCEMDVNSEGSKVYGEFRLDIGMEFYQGPEDFYPITGTPITEVTVDADLAGPFDPNGTYPNPPFPDSVPPAPRTTGPDGRAEGGLDITLPQ